MNIKKSIKLFKNNAASLPEPPLKSSSKKPACSPARVLCLICMVLALSVHAQKNEPEITLSDYKKGEFVTTVKVTAKAPFNKADQTLDKFIHQYKNDLNSLFSWALKDLKLQGEQDDFVMFNIKSHQYNKAANKINGMMDIRIGLINRDFPNTAYETMLVKTESGNTAALAYEMLRCDNMINHVDAVFSIAAKDENKTELTFDVKVKLNRPYSLMSKKQYRENIEWRFAKFLSNIRSEAEK